MKSKKRVPIKKAELLKEILLFFVPLGIYSMIMKSTHSVMNLGISRAANIEIGLAAFAVTMNITNMFAIPCATSRQMLIALAYDKNSLKVSRNLMTIITFFSLTILAILNFTPIGEFVFVKLFNTPQGLMGEVKTAAVFALSLPFIYSLRAYSQGIIIVDKKTRYLTYSVIVRIIFMIILAFVLPRIGFLSGATIGMVMWTGGIALEATINFLLSRKSYKAMPDKQDYGQGEKDLTIKDAFNFVWPLLLMSFIWTLGFPMINSGLGHTNNPELSIATFHVSRNYIWIIIASLEKNVSQIPLIFGTSEDRIEYLKRFTLLLSGILTIVVSILALTPIGNWGLIHIIGVSEEIAIASRPVLIVLIALPFTVGLSEYYMGLLMILKNTKSLSIAKTINLGATILSVIGLSILMPQIGATVGALGLIIGFTIEMFYLRYIYHRSINL